MTQDRVEQEFQTLRGHVQRLGRLVDALEQSPSIRIALAPKEPKPAEQSGDFNWMK